MRLLIRLWTCISPASDGSVIHRNKVEEYLNSEGYKNSIESGSMLITVTHRDRNLKAMDKGELLVGTTGKDDAILLNKSAVGKLVKIFLPDDPMDEWVYGIAELFDETLMDEDSAKNIKFIKGLIRNGVKIQSSSVIIAYWNQNEECEKLISVRGNDFTLNPAFTRGGKEPAGIIKVLDDEKEGNL